MRVLGGRRGGAQLRWPESARREGRLEVGDADDRRELSIARCIRGIIAPVRPSLGRPVLDPDPGNTVNPIPLYDDSVPIACTAGSDELPVRIDQIERLRSYVTRLERTPDGILLHLPRHPGTEAEVASCTVGEKACCAFWGFAVTTTAEEITLRWEGPPAVRDLFDELVRFFDGDEPLTAFSGLL